MSRNCVAIGVCVAVLSQSILSREAVLLFQNNPDRNPDPVITGLWLIRYPSGRKTRLRDKTLDFSVFSPDGKHVAFVANDSLYIARNDGTDKTCVVANKGWWKFGNAFQDANAVHWSTNGLFWIGEYHIYRYIPETGEMTTLPIDLSNINGASPCVEGLTKGGKEKMYNASRDGRRVYVEASWNTPDIPCRKYDRGASLRLHWSPDFQHYGAVFQFKWGHGRCMTADGYLFLVCFGFHRNMYVTRQTGKDTMQLYDWCKLDPPYPQESQEARSIVACINNDSLICSHAYCTDENECPRYYHAYFWNWYTHERYGEFSLPDSTTFNAMLPSGLWDGTLPEAHPSPYIELDKTRLLFICGKQSAPPPQAVTARNAGAGDMSALSATVQPPDVSWLTVTGSGGGNQQTFTNTVHPSKLPTGSAEATVIVGGGGASNEPQYTVYVYGEHVVVPPTDITAETTGDSLLQALVSWRDNAPNESGFIIERKTGDTPWAECGRVGVNDTSFTDETVVLGTEYFYRVAAFTLHNTVEQRSTFSSPTHVTITGIPWVRVLRPSPGEVVKNNAPYRIQWDANRVTEVYIELSTDSGLTWDMITPEGGIDFGSPSWGNFEWITPDEELPSAFIRVHEYLDITHGVSGEFAVSENASVAHTHPAPADMPTLFLRREGGAFVVQAPHGHAVAVTVFDIRGSMRDVRVVGPGECSSLQHISAAKGMCFLHIESGGRVWVRRVSLPFHTERMHRNRP